MRCGPRSLTLTPRVILVDVGDFRVVFESGGRAHVQTPLRCVPCRRLAGISAVCMSIAVAIRQCPARAPPAVRLAQADGLRRNGASAQTSARVLGESAAIAGGVARHVGIVPVECAPRTQRLEQFFLIFLAHRRIERVLSSRLRQQFRNVALVIRLDLAKALRFAAKGPGVVEVGVVVDLKKTLRAARRAVSRNASRRNDDKECAKVRD